MKYYKVNEAGAREKEEWVTYCKEMPSGLVFLAAVNEGEGIYSFWKSPKDWSGVPEEFEEIGEKEWQAVIDLCVKKLKES